eukprot:TRINITY_DN8315_c0_g1_i2.p1 TRINITY_DN8315_c0_g1~~TRINITY_DN8315_c0_g1_i2.p1  ORF type:complete len:185 (+),score=6.67 TRINITY_DN8315_c0_g1_i2:180-734(+)
MAAALILEALVTAPPYIEPEESSSLPCVHLSSPPSSASSSPTPKMDTELEPTQRVVMIHTGNVRRCNHQVAMKPTTRDEIMTALKCTMHCWRKYHSDVFVLANEVRVSVGVVLIIAQPGIDHRHRMIADSQAQFSSLAIPSLWTRLMPNRGRTSKSPVSRDTTTEPDLHCRAVTHLIDIASIVG